MFKENKLINKVFIFSLLYIRIPSKGVKDITGVQNLNMREEIQVCLVQIPPN